LWSSYSIANGAEYNAEVIYGDTDSVMVRFGETDMAKVMDMARKAAEFVTSKFVQPIKLEFEKVYFPYLLINKKRYAGLYWSKLDTFDKMDAKGIVTVRRDNCPLVANLINTCLQKVGRFILLNEFFNHFSTPNTIVAAHRAQSRWRHRIRQGYHLLIATKPHRHLSVGHHQTTWSSC
jgi:hypothetical protein